MAPKKKIRRNCMVLFCKNKYSTPELTYFCLTKKSHDPWMRALGRDPSKEVLSQTNLVCSDHFMLEDIEVLGTRKKLREGAVPKLNLGLKNRNLLLCQKKLDFSTESTSRSSFPEMNETSHVEIPCISSCRLEDTIESSTEPNVILWEDSMLQEEIVVRKEQNNDGNIGESEFVNTISIPVCVQVKNICRFCIIM